MGLKVVIESYVDTISKNENEALELAKTMIKIDDTNNSIVNNVVTKLYYFVPTIGKFFVLVSDEDMGILGIEDNILLNSKIVEYPLEKIPSKIIDYKELIIKKGTKASDNDIKNIAQSIADDEAKKVFPTQIPIVKVINYNDDKSSYLVAPSTFNGVVFNSLSGIVTDGNAEDGQNALKNIPSYDYSGAIKDVKYITIKNPDFEVGYDADIKFNVDKNNYNGIEVIPNYEDVKDKCNPKATTIRFDNKSYQGKHDTIYLNNNNQARYEVIGDAVDIKTIGGHLAYNSDKPELKSFTIEFYSEDKQLIYSLYVDGNKIETKRVGYRLYFGHNIISSQDGGGAISLNGVDLPVQDK